jgi:hypothetical protein
MKSTLLGTVITIIAASGNKPPPVVDVNGLDF